MVVAKRTATILTNRKSRFREKYSKVGRISVRLTIAAATVQRRATLNPSTLPQVMLASDAWLEREPFMASVLNPLQVLGPSAETKG
jgi:hypothetical protein